MSQSLRNIALIVVFMIQAGIALCDLPADYKHFTGTYAFKATPYWPELVVTHSNEGFSLVSKDNSDLKIALKQSDKTLIGKDDGMEFTLFYDNNEKCYKMIISSPEAKVSPIASLQMVKLLENPSRKLEKKYGVKAADLVRNVRKSEEWILKAKTVKIIATDKWTKTDKGIEYLKKGIKKRHPDADLSNPFWNLQPETKGGVEVYFDSNRFRCREYTLDRDNTIRIWDGNKYIEYGKYYTHDQEYYSFRQEIPKHNFLDTFMWPRSKFHDFFWIAPHDIDWPNFYGKPEDFHLVGKEEFMGKKCYVLESCPKEYRRVRRWFVGIDDGLRYGEIDFSEGQPQWHYWTRKYKEVKDGWWFPTEQGYHILDPDENQKSFIVSTRNIYIKDVQVDQPLDDHLFVMDFKDGVEVSDDRFGGFITYKWKSDRTEKEWQQLKDKARKRTERERSEKAKIDAWIGLDALDFPARCKWINTEPLTMAKLRGKAVILQFWGTWCGPCHNFMGTLKKRKENDKIIVIGVHTPENDLNAIRKDMNKYKADGPVCVEVPGPGGLKRTGIIAGSYEVRRRPYWVVISPEGKFAGHSQDLREAFTLAGKLTADKSENK